MILWLARRSDSYRQWAMRRAWARLDKATTEMARASRVWSESMAEFLDGMEAAPRRHP